MTLALWNHAGGGHDEHAKHWTARALQLPGGQLFVIAAALAFGRWAFVAVAIGLAAYGVYQLINARYRRIRVR